MHTSKTESTVVVDSIPHVCCGKPLIIKAKTLEKLEQEKERWKGANTICAKCLLKELTS